LLSETTAPRRHVSGNADTPVHKYWPVLTTFSTLRCGWWTWPTNDLTAMMRSLFLPFSPPPMQRLRASFFAFFRTFHLD